jgi:DNA invertase Pin-like site-specific DNA recombinase
MDRLARDLDELRAIVRQLTDKKVQVRFVKENLTFTGDDTAMATFLLSVMGAFAEFERALIPERQREGITLAKKDGVYKCRSWALDAEHAAEVARRAAAGEAKASLAREFGISRQTIHEYLRPSPH